MLMSTVIAVALGLTPVEDSGPVSGDYSRLVGRYSQAIDLQGNTHLTGFDRHTGARFDLVVDKQGQVEGTVGDFDVSFRVANAD